MAGFTFAGQEESALLGDPGTPGCMLWVTMTTVTSEEISAIVSSTRRSRSDPYAEHGSSIRRTSGWMASARAMQSLCAGLPKALLRSC